MIVDPESAGDGQQTTAEGTPQVSRSGRSARMESTAGLLVIREGRLADRSIVQAIATESMQEFGLEPDFDTLDWAIGQFGSGSPRTVAEFVAERQGEVVGSVIVARYDDEDVKLFGFYVRPSARGLGAGRRLLLKAIAFSREAGYRRILLETWGDMEAAVHLYRALGWQPVRRLEPSTGAEWLFALQLENGEEDA